MLAVIVLIGLPAFFLFYRTPTCGDGKMNGDEAGVDCGGSCQLICKAESLPLISKGDPRILTVSPNNYQVIALFENPNNNAEVFRAGYIIKIYDALSAIPIKIIEGETYAPKNQTSAIFEGPFSLSEDITPKRATLEWKTGLTWVKNEQTLPELVIKNISLSKEDTVPRLEAIIENVTLNSVSNIDITATLSDASGNIFAASKTFIDTLGPSTEAPIIFTWPKPFTSEAVDIDIIVRILPARSLLR